MGDMNISPDGFAPASQSFSPKVVKLAAEHGYTGAIDRLSRKTQKPRKRIKQHSAKWLRNQREWNKVTKARIEAVGGVCEVGIAGCVGLATTGHHKLHRSQGGNAQTGCVVCCWPCHDYIETHPAWAVENGFTVKRTAVTV